ncbi:hypothetical protein Kpho01_67270 [Kitasatospora phosalacinea]|uniref:Uncharacterized protein n=1 Tax=Kitasatospora phosalacinea TaxID=2065 RepID=A0A9W6PPD0_9ACTN|nr:hypothetical protein Kpho01_67270 [Kitasatospora phosalacinea]
MVTLSRTEQSAGTTAQSGATASLPAHAAEAKPVEAAPGLPHPAATVQAALPDGRGRHRRG